MDDVSGGLDPTLGVVVSALLSALVAVAGIVITQRQVRRQQISDAADRNHDRAALGSQASYDNLQEDLVQERLQNRIDREATRRELDWQASVLRLVEDEINELRMLISANNIPVPERKTRPPRPPTVGPVTA